MAEPKRGPGRPPLDDEKRKVPFSASIRGAAEFMFERATAIRGGTRGQLIEEMIEREFFACMQLVMDGLNRFVTFLRANGFPDSDSLAFNAERGTQTFLISAHSLKIVATERALYVIGVSEDPFMNAPQIGEVLLHLTKLHTNEAHLDFINGQLSLATPESVTHALELLKNKSVRMWIVGAAEPFVGQLMDFGNAVQLGAIPNVPIERNGTALIHKGNVLRVEQLQGEREMLYACHWGGLPGVKPSFTITIDDETMTWKSTPPGHDLEKRETMLFSRGGPIGSSKMFTVHPGGRVTVPR